MTFSVDIDRFITQTNNRQNTIVRKIVMGVDKMIVKKSPVGNPDLWKHPESAPPGYVGGTFKGNWQLGVNQQPRGTLDRRDADGGATIAQIPQQAAGNAYYLVNNLDYAQALEDGHSTQSPLGNLVRDTDGGATIAWNQAQIPQQAAGNVYYLVNNLPYAQALEDGHSTQSPPGNLVRDTAAYFQGVIDRAVL